MPEGEPADDKTVAGIQDTGRQFTACFNAGDSLRVMALFTDAYVLHHFVGTAVTFGGITRAQMEANFGVAPRPLPPDAFDSYRVIEVRLLPDGGVAAATELRNSQRTMTVVQLFVREGDRYLVVCHT